MNLAIQAINTNGICLLVFSENQEMQRQQGQGRFTSYSPKQL